MDGAEHTKTPIGGIAELPVRTAAAETYGIVVRDKVPAAWLVSMFDRVYQRCMFPFFGYQEDRSEEHTSELQSLMRISYAVFCLKKKNTTATTTHSRQQTPMVNTTTTLE